MRNEPESRLQVRHARNKRHTVVLRNGASPDRPPGRKTDGLVRFQKHREGDHEGGRFTTDGTRAFSTRISSNQLDQNESARSSSLAWGPRTRIAPATLSRRRHLSTFRAWGPNRVDPGTFPPSPCFVPHSGERTGAGVSAWRRHMNGLIYIIGLIVVVMFILSFLGLR